MLQTPTEQNFALSSSKIIVLYALQVLQHLFDVLATERHEIQNLMIKEKFSRKHEPSFHKTESVHSLPRLFFNIVRRNLAEEYFRNCGTS